MGGSGVFLRRLSLVVDKIGLARNEYGNISFNGRI